MRQRPDSKLWIVALVAQGIEQDGPNVKVGGSIPSGGTKWIFRAPARAHSCMVARRAVLVQKRDRAIRPGERSEAKALRLRSHLAVQRR